MPTLTAADCLRRAAELRARGRTDDALDWYTHALLLEPDHRAGLLGLGAALLALGRVDDAARAIARVVRLYPDDAEARSAAALLADAGAPIDLDAPSVHSDSPPGLVHPPVPATSAQGRHGGGRAPAARGPGGRRLPVGPILVSRPAGRTDDRKATYSQAKIVGLAVFPAVVATYAGVGLKTHFTLGLLAAALCAFALAVTASFFFAPPRMLVAKGALHGMLWGLGVVAIVGFISLLIALNRAATAAQW